jgi:thioredoxin-like negative regulator of GroEL
MDTVTYPNQDVKKELMNWVLVKVDISKYPNVAKMFKVHGIPVAIALADDGSEIERVLGFKGPEEFKKNLKQIRKAASE